MSAACVDETRAPDIHETPEEQRRGTDAADDIIEDEYGYTRSRGDLSGDKLGRGIQSITRQRAWWAAEFPDGTISEAHAQKWRKRALPRDNRASALPQPAPARPGLTRRPSLTSPMSLSSDSGATSHICAPAFVAPLRLFTEPRSRSVDKATTAIRLGVPPELRNAVWLNCSGAAAKKRAAAPDDRYA